MHTKCIKESGSGEEADVWVVWGSFPSILALLQHPREQGQGLCLKVDPVFVLDQRNRCMLSQKELVGCKVKYVHALAWVPEEKLMLVIYRLPPFLKQRAKSTI